MLRGIALLGGAPARVLAALPNEEHLSVGDQQVLSRLPETFTYRRGSVALSKAAQCLCTVIDEKPRIYATAVVLDLQPGERAYVCTWSHAPELVNGAFVHGFAELCMGIGACDELVATWAWLLELPRPPPGCALHVHALPGDHGSRLMFRAMAMGPFTPSHVALRFLFERLSLDDVLLLCRLILLERRIVLRSSSSLILTACCEACARVLLFPLQWQHGYAPLAAPQQLMDVGPWLLGLRRQVELGAAALTAVPTGQPCSIFDLDTGEAEAEALRAPELPPAVLRSLRARLSRLARMSAMEKAEPDDVSFNQEVQTIFYESLAPLFANLRDFLHDARFDAKEYVHRQPVEAQSFCRALVETTAFHELLRLQPQAAEIPDPMETSEHSFLTVSSSFRSCAEVTHAQLCRGTRCLELHVSREALAQRPCLASWEGSICEEEGGREGGLHRLASLMRSRYVQQNLQPQWLQGLVSKLSLESLEGEERSLAQCFIRVPEQGQASEEIAGVSIENLVPECFEGPRLRRVNTTCSYPSNASSDEEEAEFEEAEATETSPVLNSMRKCLRTPRHPVALAEQLLRKAYLCLYLRSSVIPRGSKARKTSKHVRIATATEEGEFLSPAGQRRKTLRSMTTSNLSLSPTRSLAASPRPSSPAAKLGRRSDPTLLSSPSPRRKSKQAPATAPTAELAPQAVEELCQSFCELQACDPAQLPHEEREAFWLNVLNGCTLAWICVTGPQKLQSNLFPMHVWLGFLQKNLVNVGGHLLSLLDMEHNILRAQSKAPKFGWIFQGQKGFKCAKAAMALESPAPAVSFGIFYPLRFGCPRLRVYRAQDLQEDLLVNCAQYFSESIYVEPKKRRVTLPPLLKYYSQDFGSSNTALLQFAQSSLEAAPVVLERLAFHGRVLNDLETRLSTEAMAKAQLLEQLRRDVGFNQVALSFSDFDWRLELETEAAGSWELEDLLEAARGKTLKVAPPPGRPAGQNLRQRRYVPDT